MPTHCRFTSPHLTSAVNINRDPRWGRNVEVASEDPLINGIFGTQYTQGIQFNSVDNRYLQAVVTVSDQCARVGSA